MLFLETLRAAASVKIFGNGTIQSYFFCDECIGFIRRKQGKEAGLTTELLKGDNHPILMFYRYGNAEMKSE